MRKDKQTAFRSEIYKVLEDSRLSESDRLVAMHALRDAELIADAWVWLKEKVEALGSYLLKPSLKH